MCYNAFTEKARTKRIAGEDIKVYKICVNTDHMVVSYFRKCIYVPLKITPEISITFIEKLGFNYVADGYHSYKSCKWYPHLLNNRYLAAVIEDTFKTFYYKSPVVIAEFIIHKNTAYYENTNGEVVSEQIMFTGIIHKPIVHNNTIESVKIDLNEEDRTIFTEASK